MNEDDKQDTNSKNVVVTRNYLQEELYKKNVELNFANEFLSIARELYNMSLLSLSPSAFAEKVSTLIREKLELELAGVYLYKSEADELEPLFFSKPDKVTTILRMLNFHFREIKISAFSKTPYAKDLFARKNVVLPHLFDFWVNEVPNLKRVEDESNIKNLLLYPLVTEERFIGLFVVAVHTPYDTLPQIEREQLKSFADIIAVSLDKAQVYKKLSEVNQSLVEVNVNLLRANEELKGLDEMKSSILSSASHHLQNPLQNIVMGTSMLLDGSFGKISDEAKHAIAQIFDSARHLTITFKMWLKVLDFENGRIEFKKEVFDLGSLAKETLDTWKNSAGERGVQIFFEAKGEEGHNINGDKEWIREVLVNLIDNAFKMTEKGFIKVALRKEGQKVKLSVEDSGVGMSVETMKRLFQKFEKGKEGWKKDVYGTGLGLYLCKEIVEGAHGGKISAMSKGENKGAVFTIELPSA